MAFVSDEDKLLSLLLRKKKISEARDGLMPFTKYMLPSPDFPEDVTESLYQDERHHHAIASALEAVEAGLITRLIISVPPRHGKSELASRNFPAWYLGRNPSKHIIFGTYNEKLSWDFGRNVRDILMKPQYRQVFPNAQLKAGAAAVDRLELTEGGVMFFTGRGGSATGRGGHLLLIDDPIKDRKEADSRTIREALWSWYNQVIKSRMMTKSGAIVIIQTRWHEDDLIGRLTDPANPNFSAAEARKWHIIDLPALAYENDVLGRKVGQALWPERFDEQYLRDFQQSDPRGFQALYQGRPAPDEGVFLKADDIRTYGSMKDLPPRDQLTFYAASDHAVSTAEGRDLTCLLVAGVDRDDNIWIMPELFWKRAPTDEVVEGMLHTMKHFQPVFWWAEKGHISKSIGPFLRKRMLETRTYCSIIEVTPTADKQARAQAIAARMAMGKVYFPAFAKWWGDARNEMLKFPQGLHDDFVDALAYIGMGLTLQRRAAPVKTNNNPDRMTFGWLKEQSNRQRALDKAREDTRGW